jgi:hypothetical protein
MSQTKTLRQRIRAGEVLVALRGSVTMSQSQLADVWAKGKYDYIWIDGQHTTFSEEQLVNYCAAAEALSIDVQLRLPHTRFAHLAGRYLDFGPSAILVPEVMEMATVDDAIAYTYYPQKGRRSWGGAARRGLRSVARGMDRLSYAAWWNDYVVLGIQVESVSLLQPGGPPRISAAKRGRLYAQCGGPITGYGHRPGHGHGHKAHRARQVSGHGDHTVPGRCCGIAQTLHAENADWADLRRFSGKIRANPLHPRHPRANC